MDGQPDSWRDPLDFTRFARPQKINEASSAELEEETHKCFMTSINL